MITPGIREQLRQMLADHDGQHAIARRLYDRLKELRQRADAIAAEAARLRRRGAKSQAVPLDAERAEINEQIAQLEVDQKAAKARCRELAEPLQALAAELKLAGAGQFHTGSYGIESLHAAVGVGGRSAGTIRDVLDKRHPDAAALVDLQAKVNAARARREAATSAPLSLPELRKRVSACIDVTVRNASLAQLDQLRYPPRGDVSSTYAFDLRFGLADLILLDREQIEKAIVEYAVAGQEAKPTSATSRADAIAAADDELDNFEPEQELEVLRLERAGWIIPWGRAHITASTMLRIWRDHPNQEAYDAA